MDLNYLLGRQQVERTRAESATSQAAREAHEEMARQYEKEIERLTEGRVAIGPPAEELITASPSGSGESIVPHLSRRRGFRPEL